MAAGSRSCSGAYSPTPSSQTPDHPPRSRRAMPARMASPFPGRPGMTGLRYRRRGRSSTCDERSRSPMNHLEPWHPPTPISHVARHNAQALGLDLAGDDSVEILPSASTRARIRRAVQKRRIHQPRAVRVPPHKEDSAADRVESTELALTAQVVEVDPPSVAPAIQIERRPAMLQDAVRLHDLLAGAQQALDQIGRVLDHVDVQPQDPRLVVQGPKEQV